MILDSLVAAGGIVVLLVGAVIILLGTFSPYLVGRLWPEWTDRHFTLVASLWIVAIYVALVVGHLLITVSFNILGR